MRFGSLFSGIGGFDLGFERAGMAPAWQCEIDPAARSVLARRFPGVPIYDDVRSVGAGCPPVDLICGGFPCQDLSVAGKRAGLAGERSGLWFEFRRVLEELRPGWVVIENVPGLISSSGGADFAVLLRGLVELGYGVAWRVLDAQYFGLAQRRRRVFIVGSLGDGRAAEVLFEPTSGGGDTAPRREAGARVAGTIESGTNRTGGTRPPGTTVDTADSLVVGGLTARQSRLDGDADNFVAQPMTFDMAQITSNVNRTRVEPGLPASTLNQAGQMHVANTLRGEGHDASEDGTGRGVPIVFESRYARNGRDAPEELVPPLKAESGQSGKGDAAPLVAFAWQQGVSPNDRSYPVRAGEYAGSVSGTRVDAVSGGGHGVRRLMPVECERLQGFPDGWTDGQADSTRYRQLGNAVAVPCAEWLGHRIAQAAP